MKSCRRDNVGLAGDTLKPHPTPTFEGGPGGHFKGISVPLFLSVIGIRPVFAAEVFLQQIVVHRGLVTPD